MRILIISEYIAPVRAVASLRWTKLGKYLKEACGCQVDLLTNKKDFGSAVVGAQHYEYDVTIASDLVHFDRIFVAPDTWFSRVLMGLVSFVKSFQLHSGRKAQIIQDKASAERETAPKDALKRSNEPGRIIKKLYDCYFSSIERQRVRSIEKMRLPLDGYDVIISTYSPKWTHYAAGKIKAKYPGICWIADYRDAVADSDIRNTPANRSFARQYTGSADLVLGVSDAVINRLDIDPGQKRYVIPHGYDASDLRMRGRKASSKFVLSYTGTLYRDSSYVSDLTPAFAALQALIEGGTVARDDVLVSYCGPSSNEFAAQASCYPIVPVVDEGFVARERAMEVQDGSSLLIYTTCNNETYESGLSGKTYEYLSSGVPILALCSGSKPNAITSAFFRNAHAGFSYEEACRDSDFSLMCGFIEGKYRDWKESGLTLAETEWTFVESNNYANLAQSLYGVICDLVEQR